MVVHASPARMVRRRRGRPVYFFLAVAAAGLDRGLGLGLMTPAMRTRGAGRRRRGRRRSGRGGQAVASGRGRGLGGEGLARWSGRRRRLGGNGGGGCGGFHVDVFRSRRSKSSRIVGVLPAGGRRQDGQASGLLLLGGRHGAVGAGVADPVVTCTGGGGGGGRERPTTGPKGCRRRLRRWSGSPGRRRQSGGGTEGLHGGSFCVFGVRPRVGQSLFRTRASGRFGAGRCRRVSSAKRIVSDCIRRALAMRQDDRSRFFSLAERQCSQTSAALFFWSMTTIARSETCCPTIWNSTKVSFTVKAADGRAMKAPLEAGPVDLVVLDLNLPDETACRRSRGIRAASGIPSSS